MIVLNVNKKKHINQKIQTATIKTFSENASYFNYRISLDTKGPINPPSKQNSNIHVIVDAFSHFVVTVPNKQNNAQNAVNSLLYHWITKFGPPVYLVTDRGSEYINSERANLCTTMEIRHSPRTPYAPWTNGLVENQNKNFETHLRLFLHNTPENWSTQVHMYPYAHTSQPLSELNLSPYEIVFHTIARNPITFELNIQRDTNRNCTSQFCQNLPLHTHYDKSNLNPFFHKILSKPIPQWILATETAMIHIYNTVFENTKRKINSFVYFNKTYNNPRSLDIGAFVLKRNFLHVHFSDKLKPLRIGPFKIINKISDITYEIVNQDGYTSHIHRNHLIPYYPKEPLIFRFKQNYNPHSFDNNTDNHYSRATDSLNPFQSFSNEEQLDEDKITNSNKETEIPPKSDFQPESFSQYSSFPYQQNKQQRSYTDSEDQSNIHDYDNYINTRRHTYDRYDFRPQPRKDCRLFLGEKDIISFPQKSC